MIKPFTGSNPRSIVVMDMYPSFGKSRVEIISAGALLWFLVAYNPDLNPPENCFSKVKKFLCNNDTAFQVRVNASLCLKLLPLSLLKIAQDTYVMLDII